MPVLPQFDAAPPSVANPAFTVAVKPAPSRLHVAPKVMASPPRSVCWTPQAVRLRITLRAVIAATVLAMVASARWDVSRWNALLHRSVVVSAPVYNKAKVGLKKGGCLYAGSYRFYVDGVSVSGSSPITYAEFYSPKPAKPVIVTYLSESKPLIYETGYVTATRRDERIWRWIICGSIVLGVQGACLLVFEHNAARERRLFRDGVAVIGHIVALPTPRNNRLEYKFDAPDGKSQLGSVSLPARTYRAWSKRQNVIVLYDPADSANYLLREVLTWIRKAK